MRPFAAAAVALTAALLASGAALAQGSILNGPRDPAFGNQGYGNQAPPQGYGGQGYNPRGYGAQGYGAQGYRPQPFQEQQGGRTNYYGADGRLQGSTERSAGGGVLRSYDADGRYLGRQDIPRGQGMPGRPTQPGNGNQPGVQVYVDPGPLMTQPPAQPQDPAPRHNTPWFGDRNRR
ncbi:hypothetical protein BKE38_02355 [Pseudoroseomonas deserti]|uniref:Translation initiation factor IF-2 n=1 Tax=Teichococcus deserti TaxID=1817963 RepID=A0A1V2H7G1_9PROT|nr:hypothetical protein [Pseudoroseomonas deserti]ONG58716.1 hypothetical protein BKE38_02355 [Pseudoroseomonas deserti]